MSNGDSEKILKTILSIIEENPGIRPRDLNKKLGLEHSNYYRQKLIHQGLIRKGRSGSAVNYYPARNNHLL